MGFNSGFKGLKERWEKKEGKTNEMKERMED